MAQPQISALRDALMRSKSALITVAWLSAVINILLLGGPIYMLLIYDSVMPSGSTATLFGLLAMIAVVYLFQGLFDLLRTRILADVAAGLDARLTGRVYRAISALALGARQEGDDGLTPMRDLDSVRTFLGSPGPGALMDLPWLFLFLGLLTMLHVWLGVTALVGALVLVGLTFLNDRLSQKPSQDVARARSNRSKLAQDNRRHVESIRALGMGERMYDRWHAASAELSVAQDKMTQSGGLISGVSRIFRMFLQSFVLTVGALLYLAGEASGGIVFASSILAARALAPIDQAIAHWAGFTAARQAWARLSRLFNALPEDAAQSTQLPAPEKDLRVEQLALAPPGVKAPTVLGVDFTLQAGDALGIIGPSAAGKTTLARALVGLWAPLSGAVRLDGASLDQWEPDALGRHLGYLPQQVELFDGTIAENIARFEPMPQSEDIIRAARAGGVHDMILALPGGYDTVLGPGGMQLSAGQCQRIGLARALYRDPFMIVLDEPNSNLDGEGEGALDRAVAEARQRGAILALVAHRPSALRQVNKVLVLQNGRMTSFGDRDEILAKLSSAPGATPIRAPRKGEDTAPKADPSSEAEQSAETGS
ncbi:MAG: type I secretion system permease/ATPase [Pseudomonadota bacterium]